MNPCVQAILKRKMSFLNWNVCLVGVLLLNLSYHVKNVSSHRERTTTLNGERYNWVHSIELPSKMEVSWIDSDPVHVTIEMKGPNRGYMAIGFSPSGGMVGADMFVGWVDSTGRAHILDMFGSHNGQPILDRVQNLELLGGKEDENGTKIVFRRKWDTCDEEEDFPIGVSFRLFLLMAFAI